ncbi:MAG: hypothetical protein J6C93_07745 [Clostridia bacterium]|nr:hypothetical protein [Clostridia bacterium]
MKKKMDTGTVDEIFPHFRKYLKSGHPALIVGDQISQNNVAEYRFRKVTHNEREGRHVNEKIYPNPNSSDPKPMYIVKRVRHDAKKNFGKKYPWKYPKK